MKDEGKPKYGPDGRPLNRKKKVFESNGLNYFIIGSIVYCIFIVIIFLNSGIQGENIFYLLLPFVFFWTYGPLSKKRREEEEELLKKEEKEFDINDPLKETDEDLAHIDNIIIENNKRRGY